MPRPRDDSVNDLLARVIAIIAEQLRVPADQVTPAAHLIDDLKADSLDIVDLTIVLEEEFSTDAQPLEIGEDAAAEMHTVNDIVEYLRAHGAA